jgi:long-subunit acyl-CoA synthetase (AMP-forming)
MTETGPVGLLLSAEMALKKAGSSGLPPLYVQLKICDSEGREVKRGETGELLIKGPNVMRGYWNLPEADLQAFTADGWLRSATRRGRTKTATTISSIAGRTCSSQAERTSIPRRSRT